MASWHGNVFQHHWPFVRESSGHRWFDFTKRQLCAIWCFRWCWWERAVELSVIWDAMTMMTSSNGNIFRVTGPCITNVFATRRNNFSQWHRSFQRKLLSHWLKFLRHVAITLVIQGPGPCCGEFTGEFPSQRPLTRSFGVFFDLRLNKRLSKKSRRRWFETPPRSLWRHCINALMMSL